MKTLDSTRSAIKAKATAGGRLLQQISKSFYVTLAVIFMFGFSAVGKAAQRVRKVFKNSRSAMRSSMNAYLANNPWGYFQPIWSPQEGKLGADSVAQPAATVQDVINDPENKIDPAFHVPPALKERVKFWMEVYSKFDTHHRIVHDRSNPAVVYGYIDFSAIYKAYANPRTAEAKARQLEQKIVKEFKARIAEAAGAANTSVSTPEEREALRNYLKSLGANTPEQMLLLSRSVRTQTGQSDMFVKALGRSRTLLPQIEEIFKKRGLPAPLARLPFVESSFNLKALSKSGAMGIWQFTTETAKMFEPEGTFAEWSRPIPQSQHAARLLLSFRRVLPDWGIAVTAYNSGAGRLARIVRTHGAKTIEQVIALPSSKDTLGFAGKNFYCELLAANLVEAYKDKLFSPATLNSPRELISRRTQSAISSLAKIAPTRAKKQ